MNRKNTGARRALLTPLLGLTFGLLLAMPAVADIEISEGWSRATVPGTPVGAGYLVIRNTGQKSHSLLLITSPVCDTVMVHKSSVDSNGVARMWPVGKVEVEPGQTVRFEPNGLHIMFMDLKAPFKVGTTVPLTLQFDGGEGPMTVQLEVRPLVPDAPPSEDHAKHKH
jgi:periplasmic copper chaperone A